MRVLNYIENTMWAMLPSAYDNMHRIATRHASDIERVLIESSKNSAVDTRFLEKPQSDSVIKPQSMMAKRGERLSGARYVTVRDGVAVIDLNGVIAMRMNLFEELCEGGTSTEILLRDFQTCLDSPNVNSIVFLVNSPGGEAFGTNEIAQAIYAARGRKPIKAYISGYGCSAAYFIACACDEVICDAQAMVGSIGVVAEWQDPTEFYKMLGIDRRVYTSSNAPKKRLDMNKPEDEAEFRSILDAMESVFIKFVAKARKKTIEQVKSDFAQGSVLIGAGAVKAGMVDRTGSLEGVISELQRKPRNTKTGVSADARNMPQQINSSGDDDMNLRQKLREFFGTEEMQSILAADDEAPASQPAETVETIEPAASSVPAATQSSPPSVQENAVPDEAAAGAGSTDMAAQISEFTADAEKFAVQQIKAGRMSPREKTDFLENFVQAAQDDAVSPLASGSRVERLKAQTVNRKSSQLTEETVNSETNQVLLAQTGNVTVEEKKKSILQHTALGKRTLQMAQKKD